MHPHRVTCRRQLQRHRRCLGPGRPLHPSPRPRLLRAVVRRRRLQEIAPDVPEPGEHAIIPDPATDPDGAVRYLAQRMADFADYNSMEGWFNTIAAPMEKGFFPPDWEDVIKEYKRNETRLKAAGA